MNIENDGRNEVPSAPDQDKTLPKRAPRDADAPTAEQVRVFQTTWWTPRPETTSSIASTENSTEVSRMMVAEQIEMKAHIDKFLRDH